MKWLLLIPFLLVVLLWLPLSVRVRYNSRLTVWAGVGPLLARVYETTGESPEPPKPEPEQKQDTPKEKKKKKSKNVYYTVSLNDIYNTYDDKTFSEEDMINEIKKETSL